VPQNTETYTKMQGTPPRYFVLPFYCFCNAEEAHVLMDISLIHIISYRSASKIDHSHHTNKTATISNKKTSMHETDMGSRFSSTAWINTLISTSV